jgi:cytochrome P450
MAPPGPGVFWRQSSSNITIDGLYLPAGIEFGVSIYAFHYNSSIFDDPEVYKPERMIGSVEEGTTQRGALIPFLRGFRACPAQKLAYASILLPVARLLWQFELVGAPSEQKLFPQVDVFGSSIQGPIVTFQPRTW